MKRPCSARASSPRPKTNSTPASRPMESPSISPRTQRGISRRHRRLTLRKGTLDNSRSSFILGQYVDYDPFITETARNFYIRLAPSTGQAKNGLGHLDGEKTASGAWSEPKTWAHPSTQRERVLPFGRHDGTLYYSTIREGGKGS